MRKMLRRGAMLALVLILLLSHTMGALAISPKEPSVIVNSYGLLYTEIAEAKSGDVIGIRGTILIPSGITLDAGYRDIELRRMEVGAKLVFAGNPDYSIETKINSFIFNGNAPNVGGDSAFLEVNGTAIFDGCTFYDCYNGEGGTGGAMYVASGDVKLHNCDFKSCSAKYGSHIYNASSDVLQIENCTFSDGWANEEGGAIYLSNPVGTTYVRDTTIFSNHARIGGGLSNYGSIILSNSLIYQNEVTIQGADIANLGSMNNSDTAEVYDKLLSDKGLYFVGWQDDINTSVGGSGEYLKFGVSDEKPTPPEEGGETGGTEDGEPSEPDPSNPSEGGDGTGDEGGGSTGGEDNPTGGDTEGGSGDEQDPTTPPEDTEGGDSPTEGGSGDPDPSTSSNPEQGGSGGSTDSSQTDNSTTDSSDHSDHSTTDNSSSTVTDSSDHSTTDNSESTSSSTVDNSSRVSNTDNSSVDNSSVDNSSSRSESSRMENSNNTTTYNYYTAEDEGSQAAPVAPQSGSQPITVNVSVPQADQPQRAAQEPVAATGTQDQRVDQNIHIEAEGVDVIYEYTADGVSIAISSNKGSESPTEAVEAMAVSSSTLLSETPTEAPRGSESWVDYATLILLAVLVFGELRDKFSKKA